MVLIAKAMIDYLSLGLSHAVLLLAFWRLYLRDDLDRDPPYEEPPEPADQPEPKTRRGGPLRRA